MFRARCEGGRRGSFRGNKRSVDEVSGRRGIGDWRLKKKRGEGEGGSDRFARTDHLILRRRR